MSELDLIKWIRKHSKSDNRVIIGPGDDAAVIDTKHNKSLVISTDTILDGTHFVLNETTPELIGRKAITSSISDIAAMGCNPEYILISVIFPNNTDKLFCKKLFASINKTAAKYNVQIIGGDIVSGKTELAITATIIGSTSNQPPVKRSGAKIHDIIMITSKLGGSILRKHLKFEPRISEGLILNNDFKINSMIDISDGLLVDMAHILEESKVGAIIDECRIPISKDAVILSQKSGKSPLHHALTDGEDYELLFTVAGNKVEKIIESTKFKIPFSVIGCIQEKEGLFLKDGNGKLNRINPQGYEHLI